VDPFLLGVLLVAIGGVLEGVFSLGVTNTPRWRWENIWGLGSLIALVLVPWPAAFLTVPDVIGVYQKVDPKYPLMALAFGLGWGIGAIFWGRAIQIVGVALGVSLMMGMTSIWGTYGPLLINEPQQLLQSGGIVLSLGMLAMLVGVVLCAIAGKKRETDLTGAAASAASPTPRSAALFALGLLFCFLSPLLSSLVNFAFTQCEPLRKATIDARAVAGFESILIWSLVFTGNFTVNLVYTLILTIKNRSFGCFARGEPIYWFWALFLGVAWPLGIILYGMGADKSKMGDFGAYAGFPMLLLFSIVASNLAGALTGEWRGARPATKQVMLAGVAVLLFAFVLLAIANKLTSPAGA